MNYEDTQDAKQFHFNTKFIYELKLAVFYVEIK